MMQGGRRLLTLGSRVVSAASQRSRTTPDCGRSLGTLHAAGNGPAVSGSWGVGSVAFQASRAMSCCARMDLPPPTEVTVEYHDDPDNVDHFIKLADGIEDAHPDIMVTGNPEGMVPRDGAFEVKTGEYVLFSRLKENRLPTLKDILLAIDERPKQILSCELGGEEKVANA